MTARSIRALLLACAVLVPALLAPSAQALVGCSSHTASAIEQYCETIPSAGGGPTPVGQGGVTGSLPPGAAHRLLASVRTAMAHHRGRAAASQVALLSMPAPYRHVAILGPPPAAGGWPLWRVLAVVLVALLVAAAAATLWRRRGRNTAPPAAGSAAL